MNASAFFNALVCVAWSVTVRVLFIVLFVAACLLFFRVGV